MSRAIPELSLVRERERERERDSGEGVVILGFASLFPPFLFFSSLRMMMEADGDTAD